MIYKDMNSIVEIQKKRARLKLFECKERNRKFIIEHLVNNPCIDCGECDILVLDFDHINPKEKKAGVSDLLSKAVSLDCIKQEVKKCIIRCTNCHRIKTAIEQKTYRYLFTIGKMLINSRHKATYNNRKYVIEFLQNNHCVDCGEDNIIVLDFDHIDNKIERIGKLVSDG